MYNVDLATLKKIHGLDVATVMNEQQLLEYNRELDDFIETLPAKSYELTKIFVVRDYELLRKKLIEIYMVLSRIHAGESIAQLDKVLDTLLGEDKAEIDIELGKLVAGLSTLSIDLQLAQHRAKTEVESPTPPEKPAAPADTGEKKIILVVDDDPVILNVVKAVVEGAGYKFSGVTDGKTALRFLEKNKPALCILDIEMPEMNGHELAAKIIDVDTSIPFMFLTSNSQREHVAAAIKLGAQGFFVKPPNEDLIFNTLKQYLG
jgi:CheY-like chemotaxis protein